MIYYTITLSKDSYTIRKWKVKLRPTYIDPFSFCSGWAPLINCPSPSYFSFFSIPKVARDFHLCNEYIVHVMVYFVFSSERRMRKRSGEGFILRKQICKDGSLRILEKRFRVLVFSLQPTFYCGVEEYGVLQSQGKG